MRRNFSGLLFWLVMFLCIAMAGFGASGYESFHAGVDNRSVFDGFVMFLAIFLVVGVLYVVMVIWGCVRIVLAPHGQRKLHILTIMPGLILPPVLAIAIFATSPMGHDQYQSGFERWVVSHADVPAIQGWHGTLAPVVAPTPVAGPWPPAISRLAPDQVDELPGGIALTWGQTGEWGDRRQVFIATPGVSSPPLEVKWGSEWRAAGSWRLAGAQVWIYVQ